MSWFGDLVDRIYGPWCQALDSDEEASCWQRVTRNQPAMICDDCWIDLARNGTTAQKLEMARMKELPPPAADILSKESKMVRASLAENVSATLEEHRDALCASDQDEMVLAKMARRPDLSIENEKSLIASGDIPTIRLLAANPKTSERTRLHLASHNDKTIRESIRRAGAI